jgi:hypothetical protein
VTITNSHLPYFVQPLSPTIEEVTFIARVNGNPEDFTIAIDGAELLLPRNDDLQLCLDVAEIDLGVQFELSCAEVNLEDLEDFVMVVKYGFSVI